MSGSMKHACTARTVCEVLREINDLHQGPSKADKITRTLLCEAERMCKRMSLKLKEYNKKYDAGWWEANPDYEKDLDKRLNKNYCTGDNDIQRDK